jgi:putative endonuclease
VVAANLRTTLGELDLVVRRGRLLVAVEVKTRRGHAAPERLVDDDEVARRARALAAVARPLLPSVRRLRLRVDVVAVRFTAASSPELRVFCGREWPAP